ncbi:MAG: hypothetical protein ACJA0C_001176, partial [Candidatus Endobugula sp.]
SRNSIILKTNDKSQDIYTSLTKDNEKVIESNISWIPIQIQKKLCKQTSHSSYSYRDVKTSPSLANLFIDFPVKTQTFPDSD